jgi:hypothetical protein
MKRYKFIGDTRRGMGFINGHSYDLQIERPNVVQRFLSGHMDWRVLIVSPRFCPYTSDETFNANWELVAECICAMTGHVPELHHATICPLRKPRNEGGQNA